MTRPGGWVRGERNGAALVTALFALVLMAAIADAVLAPALARQRASRRLAAHHAAESEAERALGSIAGAWSVSQWRELEPGSEYSAIRHVAAEGIAPPGVLVETRARRIGATLFWVGANTSAPQTDAPAAAYRSVLLELLKDTARVVAALTAGGDVELEAGTMLEVANECGAAGDEVPATLLGSPDALVTRAGAPTDEGERDTTAGAAATYLAPAGLRMATLVAQAAVRLPAGSSLTPSPLESDGHCVPGPSNWGGPSPEACASHAPVVVGEGDLEVRSGVGQGALLVEGRVRIEGPFHYRGLIVAMGGIETDGGAITIEGAVFTGASGDVRLHGSTVVRASACSLAAASDATARIVVVPRRGWWR